MAGTWACVKLAAMTSARARTLIWLGAGETLIAYFVARWAMSMGLAMVAGIFVYYTVRENRPPEGPEITTVIPRNSYREDYLSLYPRERKDARRVALDMRMSGNQRIDKGAYAWSRHDRGFGVASPALPLWVFGLLDVFVLHRPDQGTAMIAATIIPLGIAASRAVSVRALGNRLREMYEN